MSDVGAGVILGAIAFVPPVLYLLFVRNLERHGREPWRAVYGVFVYGGTTGVALAVILNQWFQAGFDPDGGALAGASLTVILGAPILEEITKGLGIALAWRHMDEPEDGIVYGLAVGMGFGATENFVYAIQALDQAGADFALLTIGLRTGSSLFLHAASSALMGLGLSIAIARKKAWIPLPMYALAVGQHMLFNSLVTQEGAARWVGIGAAMAMVIVVAVVLKWFLRALDRQGANSRTPRRAFAAGASPPGRHPTAQTHAPASSGRPPTPGGSRVLPTRPTQPGGPTPLVKRIPPRPPVRR